MRKFPRLQTGLLLAFCLSLSACASTGPKITKAELKEKQNEFNLKFFQASQRWLPRVYRVGYQLLKSPLPEDSKAAPEYNFVGVGVEELKDHTRKVFAVDSTIKGLLVLGTYPSSQAEDSGLQAGDVITKINEKKVNSLGDYFGPIRKTSASSVKVEYWRRNEGLKTKELPVEKVYYNAQFFLSPTPQFDANALFSKIEVGIGAIRYCQNDDELAVIMGMNSRT